MHYGCVLVSFFLPPDLGVAMFEGLIYFCKSFCKNPKVDLNIICFLFLESRYGGQMCWSTFRGFRCVGWAM